MLVHATCIRLREKAVLIFGESGSGKSSLAHHLLLQFPKETRLISDDYTHLKAVNERLIAQAPQKTAGLLEIRGFDIITVRYESRAIVTAALYLVPKEEIERLPDSENTIIEFDNVEIEQLRSPATDIQAAADLLSRWSCLRGKLKSSAN